MKKIIIILVALVFGVHFLQADRLSDKRARLLTDEHLANLTIDFGVIECWDRGIAKYVIIDHAGTIYAVNGAARGHAKKAGWKQAKSILRPNGDYIIFSNIIQTAINNGCSTYYGK